MEAEVSPSFDDPSAYLSANLAHPAVPELDPSQGGQYTSQNVVSNFMMDPEVRDKEGNYHPQPIPLMPLLKASYPHAEHKPSFGAGIFRSMQPLKEEQLAISELKHDSVTHLSFTTGSAGSTGSASEEQAIRFCQHLRLDIKRKLGMDTNFRRFNIPNRVCTASLGFTVSLARLHADFPGKCPYWPGLFPGLFFYYEHFYTDRTAIHQNILGSNRQAKRRLTIVEGDLEQLQHSMHHGPVSSEARASAIRAAAEWNSRGESTDDPQMDQDKKDVAEALNIYLPLKERAVVLVFTGGNMVGLGIKNLQLGKAAFRAVAELAKNYKLTKEEQQEFDEQTSGQGKKRKSQARLQAKTKALNDVYINIRKPLSSEGLKKLDEINATVSDPAARTEEIKKLVEEEKNKKKKKRKAGKAGAAGDDFDEDFEDAMAAATAEGGGDGTGDAIEIDIQAEIDAALASDADDGGNDSRAPKPSAPLPKNITDVASFLLSSTVRGAPLRL